MLHTSLEIALFETAISPWPPVTRCTLHASRQPGSNHLLLAPPGEAGLSTPRRGTSHQASASIVVNKRDKLHKFAFSPRWLFTIFCLSKINCMKVCAEFIGFSELLPYTRRGTGRLRQTEVACGSVWQSEAKCGKVRYSERYVGH